MHTPREEDEEKVGLLLTVYYCTELFFLACPGHISAVTVHDCYAVELSSLILIGRIHHV